MKTPICDFVKAYAESGALRLHMPGHKGTTAPLDITEIDGADDLYAPTGIIRESETCASALYGDNTFFSTEGSSHGIRAMLYLCLLHARAMGQRPLIAAGRNAHKVFHSAAALLDIAVEWIYPEGEGSYLCCNVNDAALENFLDGCEQVPMAVYLTAPDYLGNTLDLAAIAAVCHKRGVLLLVDNAHGAYLKFLPTSRHPIDLGADMCCSSAHKTLPALTGAAYLHIAKTAPALLAEQAKTALALFGSTSPSYLILQSLDALNAYLATYAPKLAAFVSQAERCKESLSSHGYVLLGDEPLKFTIAPKAYGYTGKELAAHLQAQNIVVEFADADTIVMMVTPETGAEGLERMQKALCALPKKVALPQISLRPCRAARAMTAREALLCPSEEIPIAEAVGRVLAAPTVACPPAIPIVSSGEIISEEAVRAFAYYGISSCKVVKK